MRRMKTATLALALLFSAGCAAGGNDEAATSAPAGGQSSAPAAPAEAKQGEPVMRNVSLSQAEGSQAAPAQAQRKIIRNATLVVETDSPAEAMRRVASVAESRGGFVVTTEARQQGGRDNSEPYEVVTVELRVPAERFEEAVREIRAAGSRVVQEKITGQDVTEEYIDLEARLRTQRALEAQLFEIMKGARAVPDALAVQRELASVRTEVERLEGRRRFLESQASLSTVRVTLQPPGPLVSATGFFQGVRDAFGDGIDVAASITLGLIRVALALIPVVLFVFLPLALLLRYALRRQARRRTAPDVHPQPAEVRAEPAAE